jgi:outer membrane protein assembly factor BamB
MAVSTWDEKRIILIDGQTGNFLWQQPTEKENMGGLTAADLDGDGLPDVLATSSDGHVYALRGKDGKLLWKTASNQYPSVSRPTVADLNGDGKLQVLITTDQGQLFALDGADGSLIWSPDIIGDIGVTGRATVASRNGRKLVLAPTGTNGVVAFDWSSRTELWRSPKGCPVIATPVLADLAHDGRQQVVVGATKGDVFVLDLADGKPLWRLKVAQDSIEADPAVADLNNDGVDDILIASHDFRLYAIDGKNIISASGMKQSVRRN